MILQCALLTFFFIHSCVTDDVCAYYWFTHFTVNVSTMEFLQQLEKTALDRGRPTALTWPMTLTVINSQSVPKIILMRSVTALQYPQYLHTMHLRKTSTFLFFNCIKTQPILMILVSSHLCNDEWQNIEILVLKLFYVWVWLCHKGVEVYGVYVNNWYFDMHNIIVTHDANVNNISYMS